MRQSLGAGGPTVVPEREERSGLGQKCQADLARKVLRLYEVIRPIPVVCPRESGLGARHEGYDVPAAQGDVAGALCRD